MKVLSFLVVDDNEIEAVLVSNTLAEAFPEARITVAVEPALAMRLCEEEAFDCLLIDYNMPRKDGLELGRIIQKDAHHLPMILMTAVGDELLAADAIRGGFADYIPKSKINCESAARVVQRAMRAAEQARLIDEQREELENFAYALSHDFKQPIRQICTFSELLQRQLGGEQASAEITRNLHFMSDAARRLGALVDVMSQYTLLNKPPELGMVDVDDVVAGVRRALESYIKERSGALIAEPTASTVYGNGALLAQVLQNLVINGLRYNKSVEPWVALTVDEGPPGRRRLRVRDNGIGIEERYRQEIFKPLVRLHCAADYPGTGLGLAIARKAVLAQGGLIWCASEVGIGSEFVIELSSDAPGAGDAAEVRGRAA